MGRRARVESCRVGRGILSPGPSGEGDEEKEKIIVLLQEKLLQKSKEYGDLLNEKTLLEEQHVKQMQAMAEYGDSINEKQQKLDTMHARDMGP